MDMAPSAESTHHTQIRSLGATSTKHAAKGTKTKAFMVCSTSSGEI